LLRVNDATVMAVGGDYADYQFIKSIIEQRVVNDECLDDGFKYTPKSLHTWLTRVLYNRRSKFNPLWNTMVVGGIEKGEPFLGFVDKLGVAYEAPSVASGYGSYIALPLLRSALDSLPAGQHLTEAAAREIIGTCMTVLFYRDARSFNKYDMAIVTKDGKTKIETDLTAKSDWSFAKTVKGYE